MLTEDFSHCAKITCSFFIPHYRMLSLDNLVGNCMFIRIYARYIETLKDMHCTLHVVLIETFSRHVEMYVLFLGQGAFFALTMASVVIINSKYHRNITDLFGHMANASWVDFIFCMARCLVMDRTYFYKWC